MDRYFSGITALRYLRTPPQVLALYPPLAEPYQDSNHMKLASSPLIEDILHTPLDCTVFHANKRRSSKYYRYHLSNTDLPFGCFRPCNHGCYVASPPYALLTSAAFLTETQLLMLAFEFCGTYSVYSPRTRTEKLLQDAYAKRAINPTDGWNRVCSATGKASNLWKREPLTTPDELLAFCTEARGLAGAKRLRRVASLVTGVCASPFEAQASILLGLPRRLGGQGYHFNNNHRIGLTTSAQAIYPYTCCYADIFFEATDEHPALDIECQGRSVTTTRPQAYRTQIALPHFRAWVLRSFPSRSSSFTMQTGSAQYLISLQQNSTHLSNRKQKDSSQSKRIDATMFWSTGSSSNPPLQPCVQ